MQKNANFSLITDELQRWLLRPTAAGGARKHAYTAVALGSDVGLVRVENQDRVIAVQSRDQRGRAYLLVALADGIGGMKEGALCASIALSAFVAGVHGALGELANIHEVLDQGAREADEAVFARFKGQGGSTLVALIVTEAGGCHWVSAGDSRVYQYNYSGLQQLSVDDTLAGQFGNYTNANAERTQLLQFIGMGAGLEPHVNSANTAEGGSMVLTSDGVHFLASAPGWFATLLANAADSLQATRRLIELAKWCGGPDNATAAIVNVGNGLKALLDQSSQSIDVTDAFGELRLCIAKVNVPPRQHAPAAAAEVQERPAAPSDAVDLKDAYVKPVRRTKTRRHRNVDPKVGKETLTEDVQFDFIRKDGSDE